MDAPLLPPHRATYPGWIWLLIAPAQLVNDPPAYTVPSWPSTMHITTFRNPSCMLVHAVPVHFDT